MPDITYTIKSNAELAGFQAAEEAIQRQIGQAKALGKEYASKEEQLAKMRAAMAAYNSSAAAGAPGGASGGAAAGQAAAGGSIGGLFNTLKGLSWGAITASVAGLGTAFKGLKNAIGEFAVEEQSLAKLDKALKNAGQSTSEYKGRLQEMADEMAKATATDHTEWLNVFSRLTQFGADSGNIGQASEAVKNLSGLLGGDLQTSAMLVSKALQGNYDMFSRYGIVVKESANQTDKLNELFKQLSERGGGQMEAMAETLTGKWAGLKLSFDDFLLSVGRFIGESGALQKTLGVFTFALNILEDAIGRPKGKLAELADVTLTSKKAFGDAATDAGKYAKEIKDIGDNANNAKTALNQIKDLQNKERSFEQEYEDKLKDNALAQIDLRVKSGQISEIGGAAARLSTLQIYAKKKHDREEAAAKADAKEAETTVSDSDHKLAEEQAKKQDLERKAVAAKKVLDLQEGLPGINEVIKNADEFGKIKTAFDEATSNMTPEQRSKEWKAAQSGTGAYDAGIYAPGAPDSYEELSKASKEVGDAARNDKAILQKRIAEEAANLGGKSAEDVLKEKAQFDATTATRTKQAQEAREQAINDQKIASDKAKQGDMLYNADTVGRGMKFQGDVIDQQNKGKGEVITAEQVRREAAAAGVNLPELMNAVFEAYKGQNADIRVLKTKFDTLQSQVRNGRE